MALRIGVYPCLLPSMVTLTLRGIRLKAAFEAEGIPVIEGFPGLAQDVLGLPRRKKDLAGLLKGLRRSGLQWRGEPSHDEVDAMTAALVGHFWLQGMSHSLGNSDEVAIVAPRLNAHPVRLEPYLRLAENYLALRHGAVVSETGTVLHVPATRTRGQMFAALDTLWLKTISSAVPA